MVRTQVQFTESEIEELRKLSLSRGESIAHLTRNAVDRYLEQCRSAVPNSTIERALKVAGQFDSGRHDVSADHDRYLAEAFGE